MTVTTNQQTALEKPVVREVYFAEFQFRSETVYLCSLNQTIAWGGHDWQGVGGLAGIGAVEESDSVEAKALEFSLNAADLSWIAMAVGSVEEYRGQPAKLYFCPLDDNYQLIDTPVICWRGIMDTISAGIDEEGNGTISLKCETSAFGLKRQPSLRMNDAQQKAKYPTDRGFEYLSDLIANPQKWISIRFQKQ